MLKFILTIIIFLLNTVSVKSEILSINSLNNKTIIHDKVLNFVVLGHLRDEAQWNFPSYRTERFLKKLNNKNLSFLILLGDSFYEPNKTNINKLKKIVNELNFPVFQSIGNHETYLYSVKDYNQETDLENLDKFKIYNKEYYEQNLGKTNSFFEISSSCFFILDFENKIIGMNEDIEKSFFKKIKYCSENKKIKNIFLFSHRLIWAHNEDYLNILNRTNSRFDFKNKNYKLKQINRVNRYINELSTNKNIYWISGDSDTYYYFKDKNPYFGVLSNSNLASDYGILFKEKENDSFEVNSINMTTLSEEDLFKKKFDIANIDQDQKLKMFFNKYQSKTIKFFSFIIENLKYFLVFLLLQLIIIILFFICKRIFEKK